MPDEMAPRRAATCWTDHCGIEPANDRKPPLGARVEKVRRFKVRLRADGHGHIKVAANGHPEEVRRRNADDLHRLVVEPQLLTQRRAAAELLLPEAIADDCARQSAAAPIVLRREDSPGNRPDSQNAEELTAYVEAIHKTGIAARITGEIDVSPRSDSGEARVIFAQILPDEIGYRWIAAEKAPARLAPYRRRALAPTPADSSPAATAATPHREARIWPCWRQFPTQAWRPRRRKNPGS